MKNDKILDQIKDIQDSRIRETLESVQTNLDKFKEFYSNSNWQPITSVGSNLIYQRASTEVKGPPSGPDSFELDEEDKDGLCAMVKGKIDFSPKDILEYIASYEKRLKFDQTVQQIKILEKLPLNTIKMAMTYKRFLAAEEVHAQVIAQSLELKDGTILIPTI